MGVTVVDYHGQRKLCGQFKLLFKGFDLLFTGRKIIVIVESDFADCDYLFILGKPFYFEQGSVVKFRYLVRMKAHSRIYKAELLRKLNRKF